MKLETALRLIIKDFLYKVIHDSISNLGKRKNNFFFSAILVKENLFDSQMYLQLQVLEFHL